MNAQEKIAEEQRQKAAQQQALANAQIGKTDAQQGLANQQVLNAGDQQAAAQAQQGLAGDRISVADQQKQKIQETGDKLIGEAGDQAKSAGDQAAVSGATRASTADYLGNITHPMAEGKGGYSADETSAIQDRSGLAGLGDKAASIGPSQDYLNSQQMSPQEKQDLITKAGISAGAGASAAKEAVMRQAGATGANPLALASFRARLDRQSAGEQGDAMTNARIAASNAAATRAAGAEQQRESGLASSTSAGLNVSNAGSTRAQTVGDTRLAQQTQGLNSVQTQNSQANADEQAALARQQAANQQKTSVYGVQSGNTNQAVGLGNQAVGLGTDAVNAGTGAVNAGTGAVNAGTGAVNAGTNAAEAGTQAVNAGTNAANTDLAASQKPGLLDKAVGAATGIIGGLTKLADGDYLGGGTDAIVGEQGPEKVVDASSLGGGNGFRARSAQSSPPDQGSPIQAGPRPPKSSPPAISPDSQQFQQPDPAPAQSPSFRATRQQQQSPMMADMGFLGKIGGSIKNAVTGSSPASPSADPGYIDGTNMADEGDYGQSTQDDPTATTDPAAPKGIPFWQRLKTAAKGQQPQDSAHKWSPVDTYSGIGKIAGTIGSAMMNKQPPAAYADGKMGLPHTKFAGNSGVFTSPTQVKLAPNEAVVPLSFRAKAKVRPSMAMLPAAVVKPKFFGSAPRA